MKIASEWAVHNESLIGITSAYFFYLMVVTKGERNESKNEEWQKWGRRKLLIGQTDSSIVETQENAASEAPINSVMKQEYVT